MAIVERTSPEALEARILEAVAECHGVAPDQIDPDLGDRIDTESLATIWSGPPPESFGVISFVFHDCRVTVTAAGDVEAARHR